jgi:GntR family transcriptional regulator
VSTLAARKKHDRARRLAQAAFPVLTECEHCHTADRLERHHPDPNEPLTITVLCKRCHVAEHQRTGTWGNPEWLDRPAVRASIDRKADAFEYRQVADQLRTAIDAGEYEPGRRIPSLQALVRETGLAVETIRRAIRVLVDEGVVYTVQGRGTFVSKGEK